MPDSHHINQGSPAVGLFFASNPIHKQLCRRSKPSAREHLITTTTHDPICLVLLHRRRCNQEKKKKKERKMRGKSETEKKTR
jgi:hypothetical protein